MRRLAALALALALAPFAGAGDPPKDAFGDPLPPGALLRLGSRRLRPWIKREGAGSAIAFSPDGKRLAVAASPPPGTIGGEHVLIVEVATGALVKVVAAPGAAANCLAFSPDGTKLAIAGGTGESAVAVVNLDGGALVGRAKSKVSPATISFDAGGTKLVWQDVESGVHVLDVTNGKDRPLGPMAGRPTITGDGRLVFCDPNRGVIARVVLETGEEEKTTPGAPQGRFVPVATAARAETFALQDGPGDVLIHRPGMDVPVRLKHELEELAHGRRQTWAKLNVVALSPGGTVAVTAAGSRLSMWDALTGKRRARLAAQIAAPVDVLAAAFSPDERWLATVVGSLDDGTAAVRVFEVATGKEHVAVPGHRHAITGVAFSPDGTQIATASEDETIRLWSAADGRPQKLLAGHEAPVTCLSFSPDGKRLATGGSIGGTRIWDLATLKEERRLALESGSALTRVSGVAFSPDGAQVATAEIDETRLWDANTGKHLAMFVRQPSIALAVAWAKDVKRFVSLGGDGSAIVVDGQTRRVVNELEPLPGVPRVRPGVASVAITQDGRRIAMLALDDMVHVRDVETGKELSKAILPDTFGLIAAVALSPDGKTFAARGGLNGTIQLHDVATGELLKTFEGHEGPATAVAFSPDGKKVASGGLDGTVLVREVPGR